jgi:membrane-associated phospholipid phosphatase
MSRSDRWQRGAREIVDRLHAGRVRLGLSRRGVMFLCGALASIGVAAAVLVSVSEDVVTADGLALRDQANLASVIDHRSRALIEASRAMTNLGSVTLLVPIALLAGLWLWWRGARIILAVTPALSLAISGLVAGAGKLVIARPRPPAELRLVPETDASFPSGHATDSAALFLALALVVAVVLLHRPLLRVLTVATGGLLAMLIGASRLVLGVHWPTDVLVGLALGATVAMSVTTAAVLLSRLTPTDPRPDQGMLVRLRYRLWHLMVLERPSSHSITAFRSRTTGCAGPPRVPQPARSR